MVITLTDVVACTFPVLPFIHKHPRNIFLFFYLDSEVWSLLILNTISFVRSSVKTINRKQCCPTLAKRKQVTKVTVVVK